MKNVVPQRALQRRAYQLLQFALLSISAGVFLAAIAVAMYVVPSGDTSGAFDLLRGFLLVVGVLGGLAGLGLAVRAVTIKPDNDLAKLVGEVLRPMLGEEYRYIRNLGRRGLGYIDALLLGPEGALVFRILDLKGDVFYEGSKWMRAKDGHWLPMSTDPTANVQEDIDALKAYLAKRGFSEFPVDGVVLMTRDAPDLRLQRKPPHPVPALHLREFQPGLRDTYFREKRVNEATIRKVFDLLYDA